MAVLLPNVRLGIRNLPFPQELDGHGARVPGSPGVLRGPWPGRAQERSDYTWSLALDPKAWPVREDDVVVEVLADGNIGRAWSVRTLKRHVHAAGDTVDYVHVENATLLQEVPA